MLHSMVKVVVFVSRKLLDDTLAYAIRCNDSKFNVGDILNMLISQHKREISNGISIRPRKSDNHLGAEDLLYLANAIYIHAYKLKYDVGKASREIVKEVNALRAFQASMPVAKFLSFLKLKFKRIIHRLYSDLSELCFFWINFPECFPVNIDKALAYVTAESYIEERLSNTPLKYSSTPLVDDINVDVDLDAEIVEELSVENVTKVIDALFVVDPDQSKLMTASTHLPSHEPSIPDIAPDIFTDDVLPVPPYPLSDYSFHNVYLIISVSLFEVNVICNYRFRTVIN